MTTPPASRPSHHASAHNEPVTPNASPASSLPTSSLPTPPEGHDSVIDRRSGIDRRNIPTELGGMGFDRRRGVGRRLSDFTRAAEEGDLNKEQFLFVMAIEAFKRENGKTFPQWTDVLEVIRLLGYRKTLPSELNIRSAEDWTEPSTAPANVRPKNWDKRVA